MRIIPVELEISHLNERYRTILFSIVHFDWEDNDCSLFEIGLYQGKFHWDLLFLSFIIFKIWS